MKSMCGSSTGGGKDWAGSVELVGAVVRRLGGCSRRLLWSTVAWD